MYYLPSWLGIILQVVVDVTFKLPYFLVSDITVDLPLHYRVCVIVLVANSGSPSRLLELTCLLFFFFLFFPAVSIELVNANVRCHVGKDKCVR